MPQDSVLGPLLFLVYSNDLADNVSSDARLFADDPPLFTVAYDKEEVVATQLNSDLEIISQWAYQSKMQFNSDKNKQAIQMIFSQKRDRSAHPLLYFNGSEVVLKHEEKHLGMVLDSELNVHSHAKEKVVSALKAIGVICVYV